MTSEFRDLGEVFDDSLKLPINGVVYRIPGPDAETGLLCEQLMSAGIAAHAGRTPSLKGLSSVVGDDEEFDLYRRLLDSAYDEMLADGVRWIHIKRAGETALIWVTLGLEAAMHYVESRGLPEAEAPANRAQRRKTSRSTAGASKTQKPASTSGTSSRSTSAPARERKSRGGKS